MPYHSLGSYFLLLCYMSFTLIFPRVFIFKSINIPGQTCTNNRYSINDYIILPRSFFFFSYIITGNSALHHVQNLAPIYIFFPHFWTFLHTHLYLSLLFFHCSQNCIFYYCSNNMGRMIYLRFCLVKFQIYLLFLS